MRAFSSNCTAPPDVVAFVRSPNIRGTFDIIWSCLLVLIICTWSVLHLNVPAQSTVKPGTWAKYKRDIWRTGTKIMWMFITLIAPEYILGKAWSEYRSVKCLAKRFEVQSEIDDVPWTAMHTHFANMGGFTIKFNSVSSEAAAQAQREASEVELRDLPQLGSTEVVATPVAFYGDCADNNTIKRSQVLDTRLNWIPEKSDWVDCKVVHIDLNKLGVRTFVSAKATHKYAAWLSRVIGDTGWHLDATNSALVDSAIETFNLSHFDTRSEFLRFKENSIMWAWNVRSLRGNIWVLDANQLLLARELGIIDRLPFLASDDLGDRNKQDLFLKVMALGQIGWFVLQIAVRLHLQLPTTLLEVMVLAFAACTVITYYLLLDKPNNASYSITLPASRYPQTVADIVRLAACGPVTVGKPRRSIWIPNNAVHLDAVSSDAGLVGSIAHTSWASAASVIVFGAIHLTAWNYAFHTDANRLLWHVSAIITTVGIPITVLINVLIQPQFDTASKYRGKLLGLVNILSYFLFLEARTYTLLVVLESLVFLPPGAFLTSWVSELPHS